MNAISIISLSFSGVMLVISMINFFLARKSDIKKDTTEDERELSALREGIFKANMKLDQVCATTNETRTDIKSLNNSINEIDKRVIVVERDLKTAFKRIDELRECKADKEDK